MMNYRTEKAGSNLRVSRTCLLAAIAFSACLSLCLHCAQPEQYLRVGILLLAEGTTSLKVHLFRLMKSHNKLITQ